MTNKQFANLHIYTHRIHGAAIYGNMDPINIPQMLAYIPYMDPMGYIYIAHLYSSLIYPRKMLDLFIVNC